jgi:(1->4)-alpha-D-glucan 1-alpha-D-glucosylmutase
VPLPEVATYRLQLGTDLGFAQAQALVPYLAKLGISHLYLSPIFEAAPGSSHGYDVVDQHHLSTALGGEEAFIALCGAARAHGLGILIDWVPNHMAIAPANVLWWDVLESGPSSVYADYFDVDWHPPEAKNHNVILLPLLSDHRGRVIERGEITVERGERGFVIRAGAHIMLPVAPRTVGDLLARARLDSDMLAFLISAWHALPGPTALDPASRHRRHRDKQVLGNLTARFLAEDPRAAAAVDAGLAELSADPLALDALLDQQSHRLAYWRVGRHELDYRRFFDVNGLVGLRADAAEVFASSHHKLGELIESGLIDGVRVDHIDGLADPGRYLERLRDLVGERWIVVEKVLARDERLAPAWPVAGTTGYDFLNDVQALFVDADGWQLLERLRMSHTGDERDFHQLSVQSRQEALDELLSADLERLTQTLVELHTSSLHFRDVTRPELRQALRALLACMPVYRTYLASQVDNGTHADDQAHLAQAFGEARSAQPGLDELAFTAIAAALAMPEHEQAHRFTVAFQQLSGAVMAKGVEDTAFYRHATLLALAEVGGDPGRCLGPREALRHFHQRNEAAAAAWPARLTATSSHDTKRSEDVRARLVVLTERPEWWRTAVTELLALTRDKHDHGAPDPDLELAFLQTLVGAWPLPHARARLVLEKMAREAKRGTSWLSPDFDFEGGLMRYLESCFADEAFTAAVARHAASLDEAGQQVSLAQVVLKLTSPGVPDIYQGNELPVLDLVDPDNRRPVDFALRERCLAQIADLGAREAWQRRDEGLAKLLVTHRLLGLRRRRADRFATQVPYQPIDVGPASVAFRLGGDLVVCVATRVDAPQTASLSLSGEHTEVLGGRRFSGVVRLVDLYRELPAAVLELVRP